MRILFIGDVVGTPGMAILRSSIPLLRKREQLDLVIANAENATNGSGLAPRDYRHIRASGVDAITLGDHIYKKFEIAEVMKLQQEPICKPANYPDSAPGQRVIRLRIQDRPVAIFSLMGRTFMRPVDCPFSAADRVLAELQDSGSIIVVDVHAEATADKYLLAHHLNGRVSAVIGTHTHVPTADEQILSEGTAFLCDVGMTGPYASILGRRIDRVMTTSINFVPTAFDVATDDVRLAGVVIEVDESSRRATAIHRVMLRAAEIESNVSG